MAEQEQTATETETKSETTLKKATQVKKATTSKVKSATAPTVEKSKKQADVKKSEENTEQSTLETSTIEEEAAHKIADVVDSVRETIGKGAHSVGDTGKEALGAGGDIVSSAIALASKAVSTVTKPIGGMLSRLTSKSGVDELLKWTELYEKGVITKEELEAKKNKLI